MNIFKDILLLSHEDVIKAGGMDIRITIEEVEKVFKAFSTGDVLQPEKVTLKFTKKGEENRMGLVNVLPAYVNMNNVEIYSCKALGAMPSNVNKGYPRATGTITLFDPEDKSPVCIMDAQVISAMRTGAVSALAAKKLVPKDTTSACLIGAGVNMRTQLLGIKEAIPGLSKVFVYSRNDSKFDFTKKMSAKLNIEIIPVANPEESITNTAFIVTCLPNGVDPIVKSEWLRKSGLTIFNIGGHETEYTALKKMNRVIADLWLQAKKRGTQPHALAVREGVIEEDFVEEISPIINGHKSGRMNLDENIFFSPTGLGMADAVVAYRIYRNAIKQNIGKNFRLWENPNWI